MSTIQEIEAAIDRLSPFELTQLKQWLNAREQEKPTQTRPMAQTRGEVLSQLLGTASIPPSVVSLPLYKPGTPEWQEAFRRWVDSHGDVTAVADDSRESIY